MMVLGLLRRTSNESLSHSLLPKKTWGLASGCGCVKKSPNGTAGACKSSRRMQMVPRAPSLLSFYPTREAHALTSILSSATWLDLQPRQLRRIPSTADGLDQQDAGIHPPPLNIDIIALICQQHRLRSNHLQIVVNSAHVS